MVRGNTRELYPSKLPKEPTVPQRILARLLRLDCGFQSLHADP